ncbi:glycosyltransferase family 2 protein [Gracilimonas mengyeensis]|uniref:Glycosyl transferase family 2 n=1 Tax=Gracilimonas mengyeensis TaxID=1302730 RepID=A0A521DG42_9BACT|nr:glycosyltransferase family 2 protein [Gracilimonas mengyeensis]SMO70588.1 Glycosyl transferase family 2 [Gracilimonas mengyeensis]
MIKFHSKPAKATFKDINTDNSDSISSSQPTVTIAIPVFNEEEHIERVVTGFLNAGYPALEEILIADGGSTDATREIVQKLREKDSRVKLIENPDKFQSFGLNRMIEAASGELFLRADGHCIYSDNYIQESVKAILDTGAKNVGGSQRYIAKTWAQSAIALASKSIFGTGGAKYMEENFEGYSDTVFLGCFRLKDLKKLGGFSEVNRTNEDAEINFRISELLDGKVYITPKIKIWYYPRDSILKLFKQYLRYGRGRYLTSNIHKGRIPFRSKAPFLAISFLILFTLVDQMFLNGSLGSFYIMAASFSLLVFEAFRVSIDKRKEFKEDIWKGDLDKIPGTFLNGAMCTLVFTTMHLGHFLGYGYQMLRVKLLGLKW